jgi:toxin ParE1/3/4
VRRSGKDYSIAPLMLARYAFPFSLYSAGLAGCPRYYCFIAADNPDAAAHFLPVLEATCAQLAALPGMGRARTFHHTELTGVRMMPVTGFEQHLVFYVATKQSIQVIRILHTARDFPTIFT